MKTTRLILTLAAALSLGLAVFANVSTNHNAVTSTESTVKATDELATEPSGADSAVTGIKIADDNGCLTGINVIGINVADDNGCLTGQASEAIPA